MANLNQPSVANPLPAQGGPWSPWTMPCYWPPSFCLFFHRPAQCGEPDTAQCGTPCTPSVADPLQPSVAPPARPVWRWPYQNSPVWQTIPRSHRPAQRGSPQPVHCHTPCSPSVANPLQPSVATPARPVWHSSSQNSPVWQNNFQSFTDLPREASPNQSKTAKCC